MANPINFVMDNTGLDHLNSLTYLIDHIDPDNEREVSLLEHSRDYNDTDFISTLNQSHHKLSILNLNS